MVSIESTQPAATEAAPAQAQEPAAPASGWTRKDLLDTDVLSAEEIELILETAGAMAEVRERPVSRVATLRGTTVVTLFYENSTRTRASFEIAGEGAGRGRHQPLRGHQQRWQGRVRWSIRCAQSRRWGRTWW